MLIVSSHPKIWAGYAKESNWKMKKQNKCKTILSNFSPSDLVRTSSLIAQLCCYFFTLRCSSLIYLRKDLFILLLISSYTFPKPNTSNMQYSKNYFERGLTHDGSSSPVLSHILWYFSFSLLLTDPYFSSTSFKPAEWSGFCSLYNVRIAVSQAEVSIILFRQVPACLSSRFRDWGLRRKWSAYESCLQSWKIFVICSSFMIYRTHWIHMGNKADYSSWSMR